MNVTRLGRAVGAACVMVFALGGAAAEEKPAFQYPVLRVPMLAQAPRVDGAIEESEWAGAAAITGMAAFGHKTLVPQVQQVVWYLGFDDKYLYLAMHSPHAKGTYPKARIKEPDAFNPMLYDDHVEIQLCPHNRAQATRPGKGFYKIMVNPKGVVADQHWFNGTIGTETEWSMGEDVKCRVTDDHWDLELRVESARFQVDRLAGRRFIVQLVRSDSDGGIYFAGWVPYGWLEWETFAQVDFDPDAPVFRLWKLGEVMAGDVDAVAEIKGSGTIARDVEATLTIEDGAGKTLYQQSETAHVTPGDAQALTWRTTGLPVTAGRNAPRNHFDIRALYKDGGRSVVLYRGRQPFMKLDEEYRKTFLEPWLAGRPQSGEWEYRIAYWPYANKVEADVDLDFLGMPAAIQEARAFRAEIRPKGQKRVLAAVNAAITNLTGSALMDVPELADGEYEAVFTLTDASGRQAIADKTASFERKHYPFEHNRIGINDEVIPPYTPISAGSNTLSVWGRTYTLGPGGLLDQIEAGPPTGTAGKPLKLLARPMRLELTADGRVATGTNGQVRIVSAAGHQAAVRGSQQVGPLAVSVSARAEYDGWYQVEMEVSGVRVQGSGPTPSNPPEPRTPNPVASLASLDLVIDLADLPVNTLYVQRMGDGRYGNRFGGIPAAPGVHFKSTSLLRYRDGHSRAKDWKSFVPQVYVGNGDRGLWFFAWSDKGWRLADDQPMLQVERLAEGVVRARVRLLAGPVEADPPRTLRFALQAAPIKPNHPRYRTLLDEGGLAHDGTGFRFYGDSVDGYALHSDEDYRALRQFLLYGRRYQPEGCGNPHYDWFGRALSPLIQHGARIVLYGSAQMGGGGAPEHKSFGGEWFGRSNWKPSPDTRFTGEWNYQGTRQWQKPEELMPTGYNWTQSHVDFFLWYHRPLVEKCGLNGTWWDNYSITTVRDYDPELGRMDTTWNLYTRRQLCKRLNHMGWELMRPPFWIMDMNVDMAFNQVFWMVENDWYASAEDMTSLQQWTLDEFRAMTRTKSTVLIARPHLLLFKGSTPDMDRKVKRSVDAMCLAHDIPPYFDMGELKRKLRHAVEWGDTGNCLFTGYWSSADAVRPAAKDIRVSFYGNNRRQAGVVLFFNEGTADQYLADTTFDLNRVIGTPARLMAKRVFDAETGEPVNVVFTGGRYQIADPFLVKWHEYRLLAIEAEGPALGP